MSCGDFKSVINLQKNIIRRNKNENNQLVSSLKIQWIKVVKAELYKLFYKETIQEKFSFLAINLKFTRIGRRVDLYIYNLYRTPGPITQANKKYMIHLLPYILPIYHNYFQTLSTEENANDKEDVGPLGFFEEEDVI